SYMTKTQVFGLFLILLLCGLAPSAFGLQQTAAQDKWTRYLPGDFGLSLELPGEPKPLDLPGSQDVGQGVQDFKTFFYTGSKWIVLINHFYVPRQVYLESFANGVVQGITGAQGVTDVHYSLEPKTPDRIPIAGSYQMNGNAVKFSGFAVAKGKHV